VFLGSVHINKSDIGNQEEGPQVRRLGELEFDALSYAPLEFASGW
jgi:hypothetical protein